MSYNDSDEERSSILKKVGIGLLIVISIILIFFVLRGCNIFNNGNNGGNNTTPVVKKDMTTLLLEAGKSYYQANKYLLPKVSGECSKVNLKTLLSEGYLEAVTFSSCNNEDTYLKVCQLESSKMQYVPFLSCVNENTESKYSDWTEGTESNVIADQTDVKFLFQASYLNVENTNLGNIEDYWEGEIPYNNYKTISTTKYYRYRDLEYTWNIKNSVYYPNNMTEASKVNEYYTTSPSNEYTLKSNANSNVAKYFKVVGGEKVYWVNSNGVKQVSDKAPDGYPYRDDSSAVTATYYRTRTWTETSKPVNSSPAHVWYCSNGKDVNQVVLHESCQTQTTNPGYTITVRDFYTCDGGLTEVAQTDSCKRCTDGSGLNNSKTSCGSYSNWSNYSPTSCDTSSDLCDSLSVTGYHWYKLTNESRSYYPSGSSTASGEKTYYASSPKEGYIRDEETVTTAYKWYKNVSLETTYYSATAPQPDATRTNKSRWTSYTDWSTKVPESLGSSAVREVESKNKIKVQQINNIKNEEWKTFNEEYLTSDELLLRLQEKGYKVYSLEDIKNNGELKYKLKLYVRNKGVK